MRLKDLCIYLLVVFFILGFSLPVFAAPIYHHKIYDLDGRLLLRYLAGNPYDEGGVYQSLVKGQGQLERIESVALGSAAIAVDTESSWTAADSLRGLTVASALEQYRNLSGHEVDPTDEVYRKPDNLFAISIRANRGEQGYLSQQFEATGTGRFDNTFSINQTAGVTDGVVRRYIDITHIGGTEEDPESDYRIYEDSVIRGYALMRDYIGPSEVPDFGDDPFEGAMLESEMETDKEGPELLSSAMALDGDEGETAEESPGVILTGEMFEINVPLNTPLAEIAFPESITMSSDEATISGITVEWFQLYDSIYNPEMVGSYYFLGELIFPDFISLQESIYILYTINVVEVLEEEPETVGDEENGRVEGVEEEEAVPEDNGEDAGDDVLEGGAEGEETAEAVSSE